MEDWTNRQFARDWDASALSHNLMRGEQLDILLTIIEDEYRAGATILDIGMGSGRVEEMLFKRIPQARVVGTDFSGAMLELAEGNLAPHRDRYDVVMQDLTRPSDATLPERDY